MSTSVVSPNDTGRVINKIDLIIDAYSSLRISGLTVNPTPEDLELALMRLEDMAAEWDSRNIKVNYNFEDIPDPNSVTNIKAAYKRAFASNLAVVLIPDFNKEVPLALYKQAAGALSSMSGRIAAERVQGVQYPNRMPIGSGNLNLGRWYKFYQSSGMPLASSIQLYIGDISNKTIHFDSVMNKVEVISSFTIMSDSQLSIESSSNDDHNIIASFKALNAGSNVEVVVVITTDQSNTYTQKLYYSITEA